MLFILLFIQKWVAETSDCTCSSHKTSFFSYYGKCNSPKNFKIDGIENSFNGCRSGCGNYFNICETSQNYTDCLKTMSDCDLHDCCVACKHLDYEVSSRSYTCHSGKASTCKQISEPQERDHTLLERYIAKGFENNGSEVVYDKYHDKILRRVCHGIYSCVYNKKKHICSRMPYSIFIIIIIIPCLITLTIIIFFFALQLAYCLEKKEKKEKAKEKAKEVFSNTTTGYKPGPRKIMVDKIYEVENGLMGVQRDVVLKLCGGVLKAKDKSIRSLIGMSNNHYLWKSHSFFLHARIGRTRFHW